MSEVKPKSFRIDDETAEKFKEISGKIGGNQQETLAKLIESFEFQQGKMIFAEKSADIEDFERHVTILTRMFMGSLEENQCMTETIRSEFDAQLKSKDSAMQDLQEKWEIAQRAVNERAGLQQEVSSLKLQQEKQCNRFESMIKDKNNLNTALTTSCNSLKKELDSLQAAQKETEEFRRRNKELEEQANSTIKELKKQNQELERQADALSRDLEIIQKQHELDREGLQLSLAKKYQEEKQKEVDKYQQKYLELLESLNRPSAGKSSSAKKAPPKVADGEEK